MKWDQPLGGGANIQSKLAFSDMNRNRRLGLNPWIRSRHWAVKNTKNTA